MTGKFCPSLSYGAEQKFNSTYNGKLRNHSRRLSAKADTSILSPFGQEIYFISPHRDVLRNSKIAGATSNRA